MVCLAMVREVYALLSRTAELNGLPLTPSDQWTNNCSLAKPTIGTGVSTRVSGVDNAHPSATRPVRSSQLLDKKADTMRPAKWIVPASLIALTLVATSCTSSSGNNADSPSGSSNQAAGTPDPNATLKLAGTSLAATLDPYGEPSQVWQGQFSLYDSLFTMDSKAQAAPDLATSYKYSDDGKTLTISLRSGVTFQDGSPFNAAAVKASLNRGLTMENSAVKNSLASIASIDAPTDLSVVLHLSKSDGSLPLALAGLPGMIINPKFINDEKALDTGAPGVGTGPYTVDKFVPVTSLTMTRWNGYWDKTVVARAPLHISFDRVLDTSARPNGLIAGTYDAITSTGARAAITAATQSNSNLKLYSYSTMLVPTIMFNTEKPPFNNPDVRAAVLRGIDFASIVPNVLVKAQDCTPKPQNQVFATGNWANDPSLGLPTYDPDKAKSLLTSAGYPNGFSFKLVTPANLGGDVAAAAFQSNLSKLGIKMTITTPDGAGSLAQFQAGQQDAYITTLLSVSNDPSGIVNDKLLALKLIPDNTPQGQAAIALAARAQAATVQSQRADLYHQLSKTVQDNTFVIPYCALNVGYGYNTKVHGVDQMYRTALTTSIFDPRVLWVSK